MTTSTRTTPSRPFRHLFVGGAVHASPRRVGHPFHRGRDLDTFDYLSATCHNSMHMDEFSQLTYPPSLVAPTAPDPKTDTNHSVANDIVVFS